ncbi:spore coat protein [Metabacillus halosaccharovorans]|uniref:spore coat protein n=1 Tax=Metabacillus halosaccharovorans TaxID=930124 RepID=UPI00203FA8FB|nr:spore coat protein [Metabacillus halosaccharovorans]MCM3442326.1 spore coat protein [Metabacillus halosaccharovorans]
MQSQMNQVNIGAHEIMECHEVLSCMINGINQFQLLQQHCQDQNLKNILQNQLSFMTNEYTAFVNTLQQKGNQGQLQSVQTSMKATPTYGIKMNGVPKAPNASLNQLNDRDVASLMLGTHKSGAVMKMHAALELTDSQMREMMTQSAKNCADQAYETWMYMNQKGYYQVPTFDQATTNAMINSYQPNALYSNQQQTY